MRKRTWQSTSSEEHRISRWSTARIPIAVRDTQTVKGFGAFASRDIRANEMLGEYAGEIIDAEELRRRQKQHQHRRTKTGSTAAPPVCVAPALQKSRAMRHWTYRQLAPQLLRG